MISTRCGAACLVAGQFLLSVHAAQPQDLVDLSLEQLGNIEVTSVSKRAERLSEAAASIFVITHDDKYFHLADRLLKLDYGRLVQDVVPGTVQTLPLEAEFTLSADRPKLSAALESI